MDGNYVPMVHLYPLGSGRNLKMGNKTCQATIEVGSGCTCFSTCYSIEILFTLLGGHLGVVLWDINDKKCQCSVNEDEKGVEAGGKEQWAARRDVR